MKQQKILFLKGLPASGKSTFAKNLTAKDSSYVRVNKDSIREMIGGKWSHSLEELVVKVQTEMIESCLKNGKNVIVDDTNFNPTHFNRIEQLGKKYLAEIEEKFFEISVEEAIKRDLAHPNSVGEKVIRNMYDKYLRKPSQYFNDEQNPDAIIVDIDGTIAKMKGRSAYDWNKVDQDELNYGVFHSIKCMKECDCKVIFLSGRDSKAREKTVKWIKEKTEWDETKDYDLFMRGEGDMRKDSLVKRELFDKHIAGKYYIWCVYDDRDSVVELWRKELGLTCFQVDYGDF